MTATQERGKGAARVIDSIEGLENSSLEAVRKFVDTVDGVIPDLGDGDDGPRRKVIDSAFRMAEELLGATNKIARDALTAAEKALSGQAEKASSGPAKKPATPK